MSRTAVIAGLGPGFGESFAWRLADEGYSVAVSSRTESYLESFVEDLREEGHEALAAPMDVTDPDSVAGAFETVREELGPADVVSVQASAEGGWGKLDDLTVEEFEAAWRTYGLGTYLCVREAVPQMREADGGTVLVIGASERLGRGEAHGYVSGKAATRGLVESLARELWPEGIHVAHVSIDGYILNPDVYEGGVAGQPDGDVDEEEYIAPEAVVDTCWHLIEQDRSAWTLDLGLRPHVEEF